MLESQSFCMTWNFNMAAESQSCHVGLKSDLFLCFWVPREINSRFCSKTWWQMFLLVSGRYVGAHRMGTNMSSPLLWPESWWESLHIYLFSFPSFWTLSIEQFRFWSIWNHRDKLTVSKNNCDKAWNTDVINIFTGGGMENTPLESRVQFRTNFASGVFSCRTLVSI